MCSSDLAGALGFEVLEDIGRTDRVLAVADEIIQDELAGLGVVAVASCHDADTFFLSVVYHILSFDAKQQPNAGNKHKNRCEICAKIS